MNDETMREAFEKWAESEGYDVSVSKSVPAYGYLNNNTREAFEGWQAACKWKNTRAQASDSDSDESEDIGYALFHLLNVVRKLPSFVG